MFDDPFLAFLHAFAWYNLGYALRPYCEKLGAWLEKKLFKKRGDQDA